MGGVKLRLPAWQHTHFKSFAFAQNRLRAAEVYEKNHA